MFKGNYWRKPTTKTTTATKIPVHFHLFFFSFETEIAKLKPCGCINFLFFCTFGSHGLRQCVFSCPSIHLRDALRFKNEPLSLFGGNCLHRHIQNPTYSKFYKAAFPCFTWP